MFVGAWKRFLLERPSEASLVPDMLNISVSLFILPASIIVILYVWVILIRESKI